MVRSLTYMPTNSLLVSSSIPLPHALQIQELIGGFERELNAHLGVFRDILHHLLTQVSANDIATQWHGPVWRSSIPPLAQVDENIKVVVNIGELAFMNNQAAHVGPIQNTRDDFVKGNHGHLTITPCQTKTEVRTCLQTRDSDDIVPASCSDTP